MNEVWKTIDGTNGMYEVSNTGKVRSLNYLGHGKTQELALAADHKGYMRVRIFEETGRRKTAKVHRIVAQAFVPNPENKPEVNHKDGNKKNNNAENLEWVTPSENTAHAYKNGMKEKTRAWCKRMGEQNRGRHNEAAMKPVIATNLRTGETFFCRSQSEAVEKTGAKQPNISKVLSKKRQSAAGFYFEYAKER